MKRLLFYLSAACLLVASCSKTNAPTQTTSKPNIKHLSYEHKALIDDMGARHTEALEYVYDELYALKQQNSSVFNTEAALFSKLNDILHTYYNTSTATYIADNATDASNQSDYQISALRNLSTNSEFELQHLWLPENDNSSDLTTYRKTYLDNLQQSFTHLRLLLK